MDFEGMIDHGDDEAHAEFLFLEQSFSVDKIYQHSRARHNRPILQAIDSGHIGITRLLLEHGASILEYETDSLDDGALPLAIQLGNVQIAGLLIDQGLT